MRDFNTKVQEIRGSKLSTIPHIYVHLLGIEKGDTLSWSIDVQSGVMTVKLKKE